MRIWLIGLCAFMLGAWQGPVALAGLPDGSSVTPLARECWPDQALQALQAKIPLPKKMKVVQAWIDRCQFQWANNPNNPEVAALIRYITRRYPMAQPYIRKLKIPLQDGRTLRGILATKPGDKPRDLVVFRCGVFCDSDANSTLFNALMNVFEENPVHLLFLNSASGLEYAKDNGAAHIGGFDEGYQNLEAGRYILDRQAKLGIKVRRMHVMGMSLGGLSTLFSSLYANTADEFANLRFGSFVALCPLVDTESEFDEVLGRRSLASLVFWYRTKKIFRGLPSLLQPLAEISRGLGPSRAEKGAVDLAVELSAEYYEKNWDRLAFSAYIPRPGPLNRAGLLYASNLLKYQDNTFSPNTVVLHAESDMLVPWKNNSQKLRGREPDRLGVLHTKKGNHCAFTESMTWGFLTQFVSGLINEPQDLPRTRRALPPSVVKMLSSSELRSHYQWSVSPGAKNAELKVWVFNPNRGSSPRKGDVSCDYQKPYYAPAGHTYACQNLRTLKVPLTELKALGFPSSAADVSTASRMERYLNGRTRFLLPNGERAVSSAEAPKWLESQGKFDAKYGVL